MQEFIVKITSLVRGLWSLLHHGCWALTGILPVHPLLPYVGEILQPWVHRTEPPSICALEDNRWDKCWGGPTDNTGFWVFVELVSLPALLFLHHQVMRLFVSEMNLSCTVEPLRRWSNLSHIFNKWPRIISSLGTFKDSLRWIKQEHRHSFHSCLVWDFRKKMRIFWNEAHRPYG